MGHIMVLNPAIKKIFQRRIAVKREKILFAISLISVLIALVTAQFGSAPSAEAAESIKISYVTLLPKHQNSMNVNVVTLNKINEKSKGRLNFVFRGSGEAIPPNEQAPSVQRGVVDAALTATDLYAALVPGAAMICLAEIPSYRDRDTGAYDFLVKMHERAGLRYLNRQANPPGEFFVMMVNKKISKPQELAGLKMVGFGIWDRVSAALGMSPINVSFAEYYTAMQQGVIDAVASSSSTFARMNLGEVAKYIILPSFYSSTLVFVMNHNKWKSIPADLRKLIEDTFVEEGPRMEAALRAGHEADLKKVLETGAEAITLTGADKEWYLEKINGAAYQMWKEKAPVNGPKLYGLVQKEALNK